MVAEPGPEGETGPGVELSRRGETVLRRRFDTSAASVLILGGDSAFSTSTMRERLSREYGFRTMLEPDWAAVPLRLAIERGRHLLVMSDPGGIPLTQLLAAPVAIERFLDMAIWIASAVARMHERGIVHRSLDPANVLIDASSGKAFLTGFGRATNRPAGRLAPSILDHVVGAFPYMAPEQTGRMNRSVDARSDLYSMGVIFYRMLTGRLPFDADEPLDWIHAHIARVPAAPSACVPGLPETLSGIVMKLLAKNAEERYQTAAGVESDLQRCRVQWQATQRIDRFPLAAQDTCAQLLLPEKLYGREREADTLSAALERVLSTGTPELMLVSGSPGVGKSALVRELAKEIGARQVVFVAGKYDQYRRDIPFSTMGQAFGALVRGILRQSEERVSLWREEIALAVGQNGQLLIDLIPELEWLIGPQPAVIELGAMAARGRFEAVFRRFIRAVATAEHPLVLQLDDLQWADPASLALLEHTASQHAIRHVLLIGAYRDNDVGPTHPLRLMIERLRKVGTIVNEIAVEPLHFDGTLQLVADATLSDETRARPLAERVHRKTGGNPFFLNQFLRIIAEEGLLTFDRKSATWSADVHGIDALSHTDNVVDLMVAKLQRFSAADLETVKRIACLGSQASIAEVARLENRSGDDVLASLEAVMSAGMVIVADDACRFSHDRIQEAAYSLIPAEARASWHLEIGRTLLANATPADIDERLFEIVDHLNQGAGLVGDASERQALCDLDLAAGRRARSAVAYSAARNYLDQARSLLPDDAWRTRYEQTLALHLELLECEFVGGSLQQAGMLFDELQQRARCDLDKANVLQVWMLLHQSVGRLEKALDYGLQALALLGIRFPDSAEDTVAAFRMEQKSLAASLAGRSIDALEQLPLATDPTAQAIMGLLSVAGACAYNARQSLAPLIYCKGLNIALEWGNTPATCMTYISYGSLLASMGEFETARELAGLALRLNARFEDRVRRGTLLYVQGAHVDLWKRHLATSIPIHEEGFRLCQEVGNLVFANYNASAIVTLTVETAQPLDEVVRVSERYAAYSAETGNEPVRQWMLAAGQLARCLSGATDPPGSLDDGSFSQERSLQVMRRASFFTGVANLHLTHMIVLVFQQRWEEALEAAGHCLRDVNSLRSGPLEPTFHFFHALVLASLVAPDAEPPEDIAIALGKKQALLGSWATHCPANFRNRLALVNAEIARTSGRSVEAMALYDEAIDSAAENGFVQYEALAGELAARFYRRLGLERIAATYLAHARDAYERWGASALVARIDRAMSPRHGASGATAERTRRVRLEQLDLATVLKASQAVSNEIVLEHLIDKLLAIALEAAGANRGLLVMIKEGEARVVAEAQAAQQAVQFGLDGKSPGAAELAKSALAYVCRSSEAVIIDDVAGDHPFADDPYCEARSARSILILPLLKQSLLVGVLYLENRLVPGAFTADRAALLEILASQAAISLENASLFAKLEQEQRSIRELNATLEQRVAERTAELEAARDQLAVLASIDGLTGICNRRGFDEAVDREWRRAIRTGTQLGLVLVDVDHFKAYNDRYGHAAGDDCLRRIAGTLAAAWTRAGDVVARYGGEEFVAVLPVSDADALEVAVSQLLAAVRGLGIPHEGSSCARVVTLSAGAVIGEARRDIEPGGLLEIADQLLYKAKHSGRDRGFLLDLRTQATRELGHRS